MFFCQLKNVSLLFSWHSLIPHCCIIGKPGYDYHIMTYIVKHQTVGDIQFAGDGTGFFQFMEIQSRNAVTTGMCKIICSAPLSGLSLRGT